MRFKRWNAMKVGRVMCWFALVALGGCKGGGAVEVTGSDEQAAQAVQLMLGAWKSGTQLTDFTAVNPEFVVADEDWQAGEVLADYKLLEPATLNGSHWRQKAELKLKGKAKSKSVVGIYAVTLGEKTVILRSDYQY